MPPTVKEAAHYMAQFCARAIADGCLGENFLEEVPRSSPQRIRLFPPFHACMCIFPDLNGCEFPPDYRLDHN